MTRTTATAEEQLQDEHERCSPDTKSDTLKLMSSATIAAAGVFVAGFGTAEVISPHYDGLGSTLVGVGVVIASCFGADVRQEAARLYDTRANLANEKEQSDEL